MCLLYFYFQRLVGEYLSWLKSANGDEGRRYKDIFIKRWSTFINSQEVIPSESYESMSRVELKMSLQVLEKFSAGAAAKVFEKEIREVVSLLMIMLPYSQQACTQLYLFNVTDLFHIKYAMYIVTSYKSMCELLHRKKMIVKIWEENGHFYVQNTSGH